MNHPIPIIILAISFPSALARADTSPPAFAGVSSVTPSSATSLTVRWTPARDDATPASLMRYYVCRAPAAKDCVKTFKGALVVTGGGEATLTGLTPATKVNVVVRAEDEWGNREANTVVKSAATSADRTGPRLGGKIGALEPTPTSAILTWDPAEDDASPPLSLSYDVCFGAAAKDCADPFTVKRSTPSGSTRVPLVGLTPGSTIYAAVRARDEAGNVGPTLSGSFAVPADDAPPLLSGPPTVTPSGAGTLTFSWDPAEDKVTPAAALVYEVCVSARAGGCKVSFAAKQTTKPGATGAEVTGLDPGKTYSVAIRAVDAAGNRSPSSDRTIALPADRAPPRFAGVSRLTGDANGTIDIGWDEAADDLAKAGEIVYEICWAPARETCSVGFSATVTTPPGATTFRLSGLSRGTTYYLVVRAKDPAGNVDNNRVVKSIKTP